MSAEWDALTDAVDPPIITTQSALTQVLNEVDRSSQELGAFLTRSELIDRITPAQIRLGQALRGGTINLRTAAGELHDLLVELGLPR